MHNINIRYMPYRMVANYFVRVPIYYYYGQYAPTSNQMCVYDIIYTELNILLTLIKRYLVQWV